MAVQDILAAVSGGIKGGVEGYSLGKNFELDEKRIESNEEAKKLAAEIRLMIAEINEGGRNARHATPSGNVLAQQAGQNARTDVMETGRNYRHDTPSGGNVLSFMGTQLRDDTTRRGQDMNFDLGTMRDTTTRRGQDFNFSLGTDRNATTRRGQDIRFDIAGAQEAGRNYRDTTPSVHFGPGSTGPRPEAAAPPAWPTPRESAGGGEDLATLSASIRTKMDEFRAAKDPAARERLKRELATLRDRYARAGGK